MEKYNNNCCLLCKFYYNEKCEGYCPSETFCIEEKCILETCNKVIKIALDILYKNGENKVKKFNYYNKKGGN